MELFALSIILIFGIIYLAIVGAVYAMRAIGLYKLAKNRQIENAWLAWLPIGDAYIMGRLCEQSPYVKRKFPKMHIIYPCILGGYVLVSILLSIVMFVSSYPLGPANFAVYGFVSTLIFYAVIWVVALFIIAVSVFVMYHIYKVYDPQNAVLYTILSSVLNLSFVFLFVIRNRQPQLFENETANIGDT